LDGTDLSIDRTCGHRVGDWPPVTDEARRYVDYLTSNAKNGIVNIGLGDWRPWKTETPVAVTSTGYYYQDTLIVAETARRLGLHKDAKKYSALAESIRSAFNAAYLDARTGRYSNGSQTAQSCAIYQGLAKPHDKAAVMKNLVAAVELTDNHIDTGILGAKYLMITLSAEGRTDLAYHIAAQETQPGWGWWIRQGATTLWEAWRREGSNNHIMYGDVAAWFTKSLAGIAPDPELPGFAHFYLRPRPVGDLAWAKASYESIRGRIVSNWNCDEKTLRMHAVVPANTTATLFLPTSDPSSIREGGRTLDAVEGVRLEATERYIVQLELSSGDYRFETPFDFGGRRGEKD
jgi:alpha-L-rhamnosidase